ncbi:hypothetical protein BMT_13345 [Priestia megaterium NBRC 15308 = ATCC 14581]|nr:hypothetical protein BMT_13345 [Priestia megaterium NBRC 15308 = ATCC 14581]
MEGFECRLRIIFATKKSENPSFKQEEFAKKVGISRGTLSALVNEHSLPNFKNAYIIAKELGVTIEEIWVQVQ